MIKLSEIINTDCYIDCGSNEKLREVYPLIDLYELSANVRIFDDETLVFIHERNMMYKKGTVDNVFSSSHPYPIHHISQIDLNG
jgi:hypothetical protein